MRWFKKLIPNSDDTLQVKNFKIITYSFLGLIAFMVFVTIIVFFLSLRSAEPTMVPELDSMRIEKALVELQQKGLYSKVQLLYSNDFNDRGRVIGQDPQANSIVRAGSVVTLRVSNGAAQDLVDNYIGWMIDDLEIHLAGLSSVYGNLYNVQKPYIRVYNDLPAGTIIDQEPAPGTQLTGMIDLVLVVSRGPEDSAMILEDYLGRSYELAIEDLIRNNIYFLVRSRDTRGNERHGIVVQQVPHGDSEINKDSMVQLEITKPQVPSGYSFGVLERSLPQQPVPVKVTMDIVDPDGARRTVYSLQHRGGVLTLPYLTRNGSILIISQAGNEIIRYSVVDPL